MKDGRDYSCFYIILFCKLLFPEMEYYGFAIELFTTDKESYSFSSKKAELLQYLILSLYHFKLKIMTLAELETKEH